MPGTRPPPRPVGGMWSAPDEEKAGLRPMTLARSVAGGGEGKSRQTACHFDQEPPVSVSHDADLLPPDEDGRARRQGTYDDPFRHSVAGVDAPYMRAKSAQFEEQPHRRVQRNPGSSLRLMAKVAPTQSGISAPPPAPI